MFGEDSNFIYKRLCSRLNSERNEFWKQVLRTFHLVIFFPVYND